MEIPKLSLQILIKSVLVGKNVQILQRNLLLALWILLRLLKISDF